MAIELKMPALSPTMEEGKLARWLVKEGADPAKLSIVGWSYGGYAALQSGVLAPDLFKSIVAIAPVTDLAQLKDEAMRDGSARIEGKFIGTGPHLREGSPAQNAAAIRAPGRQAGSNHRQALRLRAQPGQSRCRWRHR